MEETQLRDLLEGKNDWLNIQDVIRTTFKKFNDIIVHNSHVVNEVEKSFKNFVEKQDRKYERFERKMEEVKQRLDHVTEVS